MYYHSASLAWRVGSRYVFKTRGSRPECTQTSWEWASLSPRIYSADSGTGSHVSFFGRDVIAPLSLSLALPRRRSARISSQITGRFDFHFFFFQQELTRESRVNTPCVWKYRGKRGVRARRKEYCPAIRAPLLGQNGFSNLPGKLLRYFFIDYGE